MSALRSLALALALAVVTTSPALAEQDSASGQFVRAHAYAIAIDEFCFPDTAFATSRLLITGRELRTFLGASEIDDSVEAAKRHLAGDQSACANAEAFVERNTTDEAYLRIDAVIAAYRKEATAQDEAQERNRLDAIIGECSTKTEIARQLVDEGKSLAVTVLPQALADCIEQVPETPQTASLLSDIRAVQQGMGEAETKAARVREQQAAASRRNQEEKARQEAEARRSRREVLMQLVDADNRKKGRDLSAAQFCVYAVSPVDGPVTIPYTAEVRAMLDACVAGLDPDSESDALFYVREAAKR